VAVARVGGRALFPSRFQLVATVNLSVFRRHPSRSRGFRPTSIRSIAMREVCSGVAHEPVLGLGAQSSISVPVNYAGWRGGSRQIQSGLMSTTSRSSRSSFPRMPNGGCSRYETTAPG
jgi:hypothetical protein